MDIKRAFSSPAFYIHAYERRIKSLSREAWIFSELIAKGGNFDIEREYADVERRLRTSFAVYKLLQVLQKLRSVVRIMRLENGLEYDDCHHAYSYCYAETIRQHLFPTNADELLFFSKHVKIANRTYCVIKVIADNNIILIPVPKKFRKSLNAVNINVLTEDRLIILPPSDCRADVVQP